jgi:hypothetical protein
MKYVQLFNNKTHLLPPLSAMSRFGQAGCAHGPLIREPYTYPVLFTIVKRGCNVTEFEILGALRADVDPGLGGRRQGVASTNNAGLNNAAAQPPEKTPFRKSHMQSSESIRCNETAAQRPPH